jgi:hypothetical protein
MMDPGSIYKKHIETFSVIGKRRRYSSIRKFMSRGLNHYMLGKEKGGPSPTLPESEVLEVRFTSL